MEQRDYNDPRYKAWRKKVFARDRYRCQMPGCDGSDKRLNAHHIKTWSAAPDLRFVTSNGICLCRRHHEAVWGKEQEYESLFLRIVNKDTSDILIQMMMGRYAPEDEAKD